MFQTKVIEEIKTHFWFSVTFFFFENRVVRVITCKNIVERGRPKMSIWRMRIVCGNQSLQIHTQIVKYSLLFQCTNGYINAPQRCVIRTYIACLVLKLISHNKNK
jgi:hypothetical protein